MKGLVFILLSFILAVPLLAAPNIDLASQNGSAENTAPLINSKIALEQKLGERLPIDLIFTDDKGVKVRLADYYGKTPVAFALVYYECPSLCGMTMGGLFRGLNDMGLKIGKEFSVVLLSINPKETPALAAAKKLRYIKNYLSPEWEPYVHFLTGDANSIAAVSRAAGFKYDYDPKTKQFAHASSAIVTTPKGVISRYHFGVDFPSKDLRLSLVDASGNKIGNVIDHFLLYCYRYDPAAGKYGLAILNALRMLGGLTVLGLVLLILGLMRHNKKRSNTIPLSRKGEIL